MIISRPTPPTPDHMPPQSLPPLVHVSSLTTALKKLGIKVTIEEIIKVIEEEKTAKNTAAEAMAKVTQVTRAQRRAAMAKCKSALHCSFFR